MTSSSPPIPAQEWDKRLGNPVHHVHAGDVPAARMPISFALLLNLVAVASTDDKASALGLRPALRAGGLAGDASGARQAARLRARLFPRLHRRLAASTARRREMEAAALRDLDARLAALPEDADAEAIQIEVYEVGKAHPFESLRDWFKAQYETLLGTSQGPRMGSFIALYGIENSRKLIAEALRPGHLISGAGAAAPGSRAASGSRFAAGRRID